MLYRVRGNWDGWPAYGRNGCVDGADGRTVYVKAGDLLLPIAERTRDNSDFPLFKVLRTGDIVGLWGDPKQRMDKV